MDPNSKMILDEIIGLCLSVEDFQTSLTQRIDNVETNLDDHFHTMEDAAQMFESWKPKVYSSMEDRRVEVNSLRKMVNQVVLDSISASSASIIPKPQSSMAFPSAGNKVDDPHGHRDETSHQENVFGHVYTHSYFLVKDSRPQGYVLCPFQTQALAYLFPYDVV